MPHSSLPTRRSQRPEIEGGESTEDVHDEGHHRVPEDLQCRRHGAVPLHHDGIPEQVTERWEPRRLHLPARLPLAPGNQSLPAETAMHDSSTTNLASSRGLRANLSLIHISEPTRL